MQSYRRLAFSAVYSCQDELCAAPAVRVIRDDGSMLLLQREICRACADVQVDDGSSPTRGGRRAEFSVTVRDSASIFSPSKESRMCSIAPLDQACGEHATGYKSVPDPVGVEAAKEFREGGPSFSARHRGGCRISAECGRCAHIAKSQRRSSRLSVRPDRAIVVRHRIIARFRRSNGSDAPAGKEIRRCHLLDDARRSFR